MSKSLFGGVRMALVGTVVAAVGGLSLTACNSSCCKPCEAGPAVYKRPCCCGAPAKPSCGCQKSCGGAAAPAPMAAPTGAPMPAPAAPAGGQKACGAGKCG
jgi:hypothetical protein